VKVHFQWMIVHKHVCIGSKGCLTQLLADYCPHIVFLCIHEIKRIYFCLFFLSLLDMSSQKGRTPCNVPWGAQGLAAESRLENMHWEVSTLVQSWRSSARTCQAMRRCSPSSDSLGFSLGPLSLSQRTTEDSSGGQWCSDLRSPSQLRYWRTLVCCF